MITTPSDFRALLLEFGDTNQYPDAVINVLIPVSASFIDENRWGKLATWGQGLWLAHNLVLMTQAINRTGAGATPGKEGGSVSQRSLGDASQTLSTDALMIEGGGEYNSTAYGRLYLMHARWFGSGGMQIV